jgi:hypothetical protein
MLLALWYGKVVNVVIRKVGALWEVQLLQPGLWTWLGTYKTEARAKREVKRIASRYDVTLVNKERAVECAGCNSANSVGARRRRVR